MVLWDWNDLLTDPEGENVFRVFLDAPESYTFLTMDAALAGDYTYLPFESLIDHVMITSDALGEYGAGTTDVLELERNYPDYRSLISDHRPVLSRFELP